MTTKNKTPQIRFKGFSEEWNQHKLGELLVITSASRVHKNEWTESGVRFFRSSDVVADYKGLTNNKAFISFDLYKELSNKSGCVQKNDLLVTGGGSIGIPYLVKTNEPLYFKDADLLWLKNSDHINGYFLYTFFSTLTFRSYVSSITHIGTISHYTIEQAKSTPINLPVKKEQDKVSDYFQHLDKLIEQKEKKYQKLRQFKKAMLDKMFPENGAATPEIRFKGFSGEWEEKKLGEICKIAKSGGTPTSTIKEYYDGNIPFLSISDMTSQGKYLQYTTNHISELGLLNSSSWIVPKDSIIYSMYASVGFVAINKISLATSQAVLNLILKESVNLEFIYYVLMNFQKVVAAFVTTGTQGNLNAQSVKDFIIQLPHLSEQTKIGNYFQHLDKLIDLHRQELKKLKNIKKASLEKMFV